MKFNLNASFTFSKDILEIDEKIRKFLAAYNKSLHQKDKNIEIKEVKVDKNRLSFKILSEGIIRPHNILLNLKNNISKWFGKDYHVGVRDVFINSYSIEFELEKEPLKEIKIPFAEVKITGRNVEMILKDVSDEFLQKNYIDRMIGLIKEKVINQYYEGKKEFWQLIWQSQEKEPIWNKDPTEEMIKLGWLKQGPTKGKWFYRPEAAAILKTMARIAVEEVLKPLGFKEVIESNIVPFDVWLKTGHLEGMPGEIYYITEPATRAKEKWEHFIDLVKIIREVPYDELKKNISIPTAGLCYAQCPLIYWSLKGKTISEKSLPVLVYENTVISARYESGGRHGIERVDEFHRIEPVYIGSREQLLNLREKLIERYKKVFNDIFDLEWRMAWVTPWYLQQAGKFGEKIAKETGTIDFEAYIPYRGDRKNSEWLEFQNLSILGDKYIKAFNIKAQKSELWSGCSGIGLERWMVAFLAQKGLNPNRWPDSFRKYLDKIPEGIKFV